MLKFVPKHNHFERHLSLCELLVQALHLIAQFNLKSLLILTLFLMLKTLKFLTYLKPICKSILTLKYSRCAKNIQKCNL